MSGLHEACIDGNINCVQSLIDSGVDLESKDRFGGTPLLCASIYGHIDIVKLLIDSGPSCMAAPAVRSGVNIESRVTGGYTALHCASYNNHINIVILLLDSGANIEARNDKGKTAKQVTRKSTIKGTIEQYGQLVKLKEWRPWNNYKYPIKYRQVMKTLVLLAKTYTI